MGTRHLEALFNPKSIAVIGASERSNNLGGMVLRNLMSTDYSGRLVVVNDKGYHDVHGVPCVKRPQQMPFRPDLAIICTPPESVPRIVRVLGNVKVKTAMILTGGLSRTHSRSGRPLMYSVQEIASEYGIRILGPETIGMLSPASNLNATYMHMGVLPGKIAYIGQSGSLASAVIDWAFTRGIGFSHLTTLGDGIDVGLDDLIDYLAQDRSTKAILLHMENIHSPRRFISAVRAVSRGKLVIAVKSGRTPASQWRPAELPLGVVDGDKIFDAVFRRAGVLRVNGADEMFDALETLTRMKPVRGEPLHIISNGLGPGVLAVDRLASLNGELGSLSPETVSELGKHLPPYWTRRNPIDLNYDANPELYRRTLEILGRDPHVSNVLVLYAPSLTEDSLQVADAVIEAGKRSHLNIFTCWLGHSTVYDAREAFFHSGVPTFSTPDKAVKAFMHMVNHQRSQRVLRETPESYTDPIVDRSRARKTIQKIYASGRRVLTNAESRQILTDYGINMQDTRYCETEEQVVEVAREFGSPVDIRILHEHSCIPFKDEKTGRGRYKGRVKGLVEEASIRDSCRYLLTHYREHFPDSGFLGFAVQPSFQTVGGVGFSLGVTRDPVFGPLMVCGASGAAVNVSADRKLALPPLNMVLARDLLLQTHMFRLLKDYSYNPEQDIAKICETLVILSQIIIDIPEIKGLEVMPLYFDKHGAVAVNAMIDLDKPAKLAIQPYPQELREWIMLPKSKRKAEIRPVRGEDEPSHIEFYSGLSPESIRYRFFHYRKSFTHDEMVQMLQIDYDREMAFIAMSPKESGYGEDTLGTVRAWTDADNLQCEFAIIVRDDLRGENLGWVLMRKIIEYCREKGTVEMVGSVLPDNKPMLRLAEKLGFSIRYDDEEGVMALRLPLNAPDEWQAERLKYK
ncbi:bifunctional acetate--CoA ligase family protein/GNAT family N-acetyltransferase [Hahella sp. HN01]|uniref:bifunctional acetate--CoA ligase family protein/GNAT family N-acetyltransferase n=1 Tax=Hahella sp. HN01 TaxID=2847262 RepID=UPI001C1E9A85|nr:bifunctional acetate--CoA ligase family protein/GNAT family N-acetyltransferase [Hahella sp. HN01]MBU6953014.1 bifunctional acetate--CoA ligase family protein/GNAT family N-acetyltransferase [Hahella sp. HN01]